MIPPDLELPKPVSGFSAYVRDGELLFSWNAPDDKTRAGILGYKIFVEDLKERERCGCRPFREWSLVELGAGGVLQEGKVKVRRPVDPSLVGRTYGYLVVPVSRKGFAGAESREITISWEAVPPVPEGLAARPGDGEVLLEWGVPAGEPPPRVNIYRRSGGEPFPDDPVNSLPVEGTRYRDKGLENGRTYFYTVRATASAKGPWIEGPAAPEVEATPVDRVAPAPPSGLEVIPGGNRVRLLWEENREADLAGYRVYRRAGGRGGFTRIGDVRKPATLFTDVAPPVGQGVEYYVTAYDGAPSPNESGPSRIVSMGP